MTGGSREVSQRPPEKDLVREERRRFQAGSRGREVLKASGQSQQPSLSPSGGCADLAGAVQPSSSVSRAVPQRGVFHWVTWGQRAGWRGRVRERRPRERPPWPLVCCPCGGRKGWPEVGRSLSPASVHTASPAHLRCS